MDTRLQRCLDGDIGRGELPLGLLRRARWWRALFDELRSRTPRRAPPGLRAEVMDRIRSTGS